MESTFVHLPSDVTLKALFSTPLGYVIRKWHKQIELDDRPQREICFSSFMEGHTDLKGGRVQGYSKV